MMYNTNKIIVDTTVPILDDIRKVISNSTTEGIDFTLNNIKEELEDFNKSLSNIHSELQESNKLKAEQNELLRFLIKKEVE